MDSPSDPPTSPPPAAASASDSKPWPEILRPIPRRPFRLNFTSPTPPQDDDSRPPSAIPTPSITASDLRFLDIHNPSPLNRQSQASSSITRAASLLNLTGSTLLGIYSPTLTPGLKGDFPHTPAAVPEEEDPFDSNQEVRDVGVDNRTYQILKARRESFSHQQPPPSSSSRHRAYASKQSHDTTQSLILRSSLLFLLGIGYGVLVTHLPSKSSTTDTTTTSIPSLLFWGLSALSLGLLLPRFDRYFSTSHSISQPTSSSQGQSSTAQQDGASEKTDWPLLIRSIGAFIGIIFAIRRLPWTSTLQLSLTLALANPFLWYLIDRSKSGFLLSAAVGLAGSVVMLGSGIGEGVLPAPFFGSQGGQWDVKNGTSMGRNNGRGGVGIGGEDTRGGIGNGGGEEVIERGVWILSVLFCSCVCFGNIGRRLALGGGGGGRGRWGGVR
ncbi:insulin-induced protein-domain-containing protein, partial [Cladorrhinum sp. PSN259]